MQAARLQTAIGDGDLRVGAVGIVDVDDWTIHSPRAPLPCHGCEYGGYRGTWSSVNESLLTYLWRNSVKDFPPSKPKQRISEIERRESGRGGVWRWRRRRGRKRRGGTWCCVTRCVWHTCIRVMDRSPATEIVTAIVTDQDFKLWGWPSGKTSGRKTNTSPRWAVSLSLWS